MSIVYKKVSIVYKNMYMDSQKNIGRKYRELHSSPPQLTAIRLFAAHSRDNPMRYWRGRLFSVKTISVSCVVFVLTLKVEQEEVYVSHMFYMYATYS